MATGDLAHHYFPTIFAVSDGTFDGSGHGQVFLPLASAQIDVQVTEFSPTSGYDSYVISRSGDNIWLDNVSSDGEFGGERQRSDL
jgi:hypothetical protein